MAQPMQDHPAPERLLEIFRLEDAANAEGADCIQFPESHHFNDVVTSLEQEAFSAGADFVGK